MADQPYSLWSALNPQSSSAGAQGVEGVNNLPFLFSDYQGISPQGLANADPIVTTTPGSDGNTGFDPSYYLQANPDVAADPFFGSNPLQHYNMFGQAEGRMPNAGGGVATPATTTSRQPTAAEILFGTGTGLSGANMALLKGVADPSYLGTSNPLATEKQKALWRSQGYLDDPEKIRMTTPIQG
jgi:hypothetical protein